MFVDLVMFVFCFSCLFWGFGCFCFLVFPGFYMHVEVEVEVSKCRSVEVEVVRFAKIEWLQGSLLYLSREESLGNHFFEEFHKKQR